MKIHELTTTSHKAKKRVGRGIAAGQGKTAGRGTKGQNSRTGGGVRLGFEGGQNPLAKRIPKKRGFRPINQVTYQIVNVDQLARQKGTTFGIAELKAAGLIKHIDEPVKLLARSGEQKLDRKLNVTVDAVSKTAKTMIEDAGGSVELVAKSPKPTKAPAAKE